MSFLLFWKISFGNKKAFFNLHANIWKICYNCFLYIHKHTLHTIHLINIHSNKKISIFQKKNIYVVMWNFLSGLTACYFLYLFIFFLQKKKIGFNLFHFVFKMLVANFVIYILYILFHWNLNRIPFLRELAIVSYRCKIKKNWAF